MPSYGWVILNGVFQFTDGIAVGDGSALLPSYAFSSEPTLGFYRAGAASIIFTGLVGTTVGFRDANSGNTLNLSSAAGAIFRNNANTSGSIFKIDTLPTVTAGGGTSPGVTAGSTALAGSVNVGTGAPGATITVTFGGTAFPSPPFVVCMNVTTGLAVKATSSTTTLVITPQTGNFGVSDVIAWICIGSK